MPKPFQSIQAMRVRPHALAYFLSVLRLPSSFLCRADPLLSLVALLSLPNTPLRVLSVPHCPLCLHHRVPITFFSLVSMSFDNSPCLCEQGMGRRNSGNRYGSRRNPRGTQKPYQYAWAIQSEIDPFEGRQTVAGNVMVCGHGCRFGCACVRERGLDVQVHLNVHVHVHVDVHVDSYVYKHVHKF